MKMASVGKGDVDVKIDPVMEKPWQRAKRFETYDYYRKSAYPPMQIEPQPFERNRLSGQGMTPEQRALRKQWVHDQILHHEPRLIPEVQPYNFFQRIYRWPADVLIYKPLKSFFGHDVADTMRYTVPKFVMALFLSSLIWYQLKYNQSWTEGRGLSMYSAKPAFFGEEARNAPEKDKTDFYDRGFKSRTVLLPKD